MHINKGLCIVSLRNSPHHGEPTRKKVENKGSNVLFGIINRGYLLFLGDYQIYFIECGEKNQYFSRVRSTSENVDIFTARDEIYFVFAVKK